MALTFTLIYGIPLLAVAAVFVGLSLVSLLNLEKAESLELYQPYQRDGGEGLAVSEHRRK
jgi:hypothetical protein